MSGNAAAMQVFIFCNENYAKRTGADAIKDGTALEGFHQMSSCFVTMLPQFPTDAFPDQNIHDFWMNFFLLFCSPNGANGLCNLSVYSLCEF